nr:CDP-alcohol phosphatidyltransferase family protein [Terriglobus sp. TAA 43]
MLKFGCAAMSDGDFLRAFQDRDIATSQFHHGDHLRLAWLLLERLPFDDALDSVRKGLQNFALRTGNAAHYNETVTQGWMRLLAAQEAKTFADAMADYPEEGDNPLHAFWQPETLKSEASRTGWVPPDVSPLPPMSNRWKLRATAPRTRRSTPLPVDALPETASSQTLPLPFEEQTDPENPREELAAAARDTFQLPAHHPERATLEEDTHGRMSSRFTWTSAFGKGSGWLLQKIVNGLALSKISPNTLTFIGLIINIVAAFFFGYARGENAHRMFLYAGLILIGAGLFDMVDGRVARQTNQVSVFGAFFDSVIDRYSDVAIFFGLLVYYARGNRFVYVVLVAFVMTASLMVSYTRARAEALIGSCKVGFMERPERIVLVILGALADTWGVMAPALWVLAFLSTVTVIHRIRFTYTETERRKLQPAR